MSSAIVYDCLLRADSPIYYATREIGRLYETGDHLHNFALTYALGLAATAYHIDHQVPTYAEDLALVNARGIYVTPATPIWVQHSVSTIKFGGETHHEIPLDKNKNYPNYGRIKEIAPGSRFSFQVIARQLVKVPRWIRLGIWMSKCEVIISRTIETTKRGGQYTYTNALNPLDLDGELVSFDIVPMPPNSLIRNVTYNGQWLVGEGIRLPAGMTYLRGYNAKQ
jgi:CRISPR-associated protein Csc1